MMKCQECEKFLEEYLDGELDASTTTLVEAHLAACEICANAYDALRSEAALYATYERGIEVSPRMWGGVEARILSEMTGREVGLLQRVSAWFAPLFTAPRFSPALTAALVLIAVALTVGVMKLTGSRGQSANDIARNEQFNVRQGTQPTTATTPQPSTSTTPPAETATPARVETPATMSGDQAEPKPTPESKPSPENRKSPGSERKRVNELSGGAQILTASKTPPTTRTNSEPQTPEQLVREAEQRYLAAIQMLQRDVASKRSKIDPQTTARFDETLAAIDRSIAETRRTVAAHSNDPVAVQYMLSAYAKKVEVLREMAHIEQ